MKVVMVFSNPKLLEITASYLRPFYAFVLMAFKLLNNNLHELRILKLS